MHDDQDSGFFPTWKQALLIGLGFFILTAVVYGSSLGNKFIVLDDPFVIYNNLAIRSINWTTLKHIFTSYDPELYTPLTFVTYQLTYLVGGLSPAYYHLFNLVVHTLNALLVAWLIAILSKNRGAGVLAGLLFAVHPMNTEVVAWATARKEALSAFFFFASFIGYLRFTRGSRSAYWLSIALFFVGLLCKVTIFTLPILLLLADFLEGRPIDRKALLNKLLYLVFAIVFVIVGIIPKEGIVASTTTLEKILMAGKSTVFYLWKFLVPVGLSVLYPNKNPISLSSIEFPVSVGITLILIAAALLSLKRTRKVAFGFFFFLIAIAPTFIHFNRTASIQSASGTGIQFASDHYAYVPLVGLLFLVAALWTSLWNKPTRAKDISRTHDTMLGVAGVLVIGFGILASNQAGVWLNSETLFTHALALYPYSTASRVNLSVIYRQTGRMDQELKVLQDGLTYGPNSKIYTGLAAIRVRDGDISGAEAYYKQATEIDPTNSEPHFGRGVMLANEGKNDEAEAEYRQALKLDPDYVAAYNNLGSLLLSEGKEQEAEQNFRTAVTINPTFREGFYNLGALYESQKKIDAAIAAFEQASEIDPQQTDARLELVPLYLQKGENTKAFDQIKAVLKIDPKNEPARQLIEQMKKMGILG